MHKNLALLLSVVFLGLGWSSYEPWWWRYVQNQPTVPLHPVKNEETLIDKILIFKVTKGSPADLAGVQDGDVILTANGQSFRTAEALIRFIISKQQRTSFRILRNSQELNFDIQPNMKPPKFGFELFVFEQNKQVFPTFVSSDDEKLSGGSATFGNPPSSHPTHVSSIQQEQVKSAVACGMGMRKAKLTVGCTVRSRDLYTRPLVINPMDDLKIYTQNGMQPLYPVDTTGTRISNDSVFDVVPFGVTFETNGIPPPYSLEVKVGDETYFFSFDTIPTRILN
jgi:membrane-associated protease RseP (regulator of RpoE activity)